MEIWERHNIKSSILANGKYAEMHPEVIAELVNQGQEIISHSYDQAVWMA
jgi:peptidoglycan/xylan/chitin deacetylase (PgdA/CDA1 family)